MLEITKEFDLSKISWSDQKYEEAAAAATQRIPVLQSYLVKVDKDDRYRYELVKRMITVKAKKQTELATKRRNRSGIPGHTKHNSGQEVPQEAMSVDSDSQSQDGYSPKSSPTPQYSYSYHPNGADHPMPKPYQYARPNLPLSPQSGQSNPADISDIFLAQTRRNLPMILLS